MKAVVDTNLLVSAAISISGPPSRVIDLWLAGGFELVMSPVLFGELADVLSRPRIQRFTTRSQRGVTLVDEVRAVATFVKPAIAIEVVRDPDDNRVLEAAVAGAAEVILSGDKDLLDLHEYEGIPIVTAVQFLEMLAELGQLGAAET